MNKSGSFKPQFHRSISAKPGKNLFEYETQGVVMSISDCKSTQEDSCKQSKLSSKTQKIKYRKSSRGSTLNASSRSSSLHDLNPDLSLKFNQIAQQKFYILPHENMNCFIVQCSSYNFKVNIGPQTCSCIAASERPSFPCVHLLFVMCKVLKVSERDPILLKDRLKSSEVDVLLSQFNKRKNEKVKNPCKSREKNASILKFNQKSVSKQRSRSIVNSKNDVREPSGMYLPTNNFNVTQAVPSNTNAGLATIQDVSPDSLDDEIKCSICLCEMTTMQSLVFCDSCSNEFHRKCISIWMKECQKQEEPITCPLCRDRWIVNERIDPSSIIINNVLPRSQSTFVPVHSNSHRVGNSKVDMGFIANSTSNLVSPKHINRTSYSSTCSNTHGTTYSHKQSTTRSSSRSLGYCFSEEVADMLMSDLSDRREAGLRLVAEKTVHIVISAGTSSPGCQQLLDSGISAVGSMGGHTTGIMLKESFRVIARLLDDLCYNLFVAALRAFREILGFLVCGTETDVERMSRMISPVIYQLLRICGDCNQNKKKAQMSLSALFELSKGQAGGIALGRELKTTSLPVTGYHRLAKFVLSESQRFRAVHCYGRLALLERLVDKFDLSIEVLRRTLGFVRRQLVLMHRSTLLAGTEDSSLAISPTVIVGTGDLSKSPELLEATDVDTGLSSSDIQILSNPKLNKLAKVLFVTVARVTMAKLKFNGWTSEEVYCEVLKDVSQMPEVLRDKLSAKLKLPLNAILSVTSTTSPLTEAQSSNNPPPPISMAVSQYDNNIHNNINNAFEEEDDDDVKIIEEDNNNNNNNNNANNKLSDAVPTSTEITANTDVTPQLSNSNNFCKSYRMSKRYSAAQKSGGGANPTVAINYGNRTRSSGSISCIGGAGSNNPGNGTNSNIGTNSCRISPFIRITPEPAYDAVPLSDDDDDDDDDDEDDDQIDEFGGKNDFDRRALTVSTNRRGRHSAAVAARRLNKDVTRETQFYSELAIHNSLYGQSCGKFNRKSGEAPDKCAVGSINNGQMTKSTEILDGYNLHSRSLKMIKSVVKETSNAKITVNSEPESKNIEKDSDDETDLESRSPPGLGVFTGEYRLGYEWSQGHLLGTGAFSKCYQARDTRTGLLMAVKQVSLGPSSLGRYEEVVRAVRTEVQIMVHMKHKNVLPLLGAVLNTPGYNGVGCLSGDGEHSDSVQFEEDDEDQQQQQQQQQKQQQQQQHKQCVNKSSNRLNNVVATDGGARDAGDDIAPAVGQVGVDIVGGFLAPTVGEASISMFVRWMPGGSVAGLLAQYGAFRESVTLGYAVQTARGLSYIHNCGILHRDLKGANLLLDSSGMRLRISDFGASARLSNGRDSNASDFRGQLLGTIAFMAPEVLRGEQYGRSCDVWSFACCIIEMLTGSQPWRDHNHTNHLALMYTIASAEEPPTLPERISKELSELLNDCLNRDPKIRPLSSQLESFKVFQQLLS